MTMHEVTSYLVGGSEGVVRVHVCEQLSRKISGSHYAFTSAKCDGLTDHVVCRSR